jgi:hypothetical protein
MKWGKQSSLPSLSVTPRKVLINIWWANLEKCHCEICSANLRLFHYIKKQKENQLCPKAGNDKNYFIKIGKTKD